MIEVVGYLLTGCAVGAGYALVGSGLVAIYRVTRVVNFAQGGFAVVAGLSAATLLATGLPHGVAEVLAVGIAAVAGLLVGLVAIGRPATTPGAALIVTLGMAVFGYAVEVLVWGDQPRSFAGLPGAVAFGTARVPAQYLLVLAVAVPVFAGTALFFARTDVGRALSACASNRHAARLVGINVTRMGLLAFGIGGALGGLAGVLITPAQQISFDSDVTLIVNGYAAAIFGGLTRPAVTLAGGLVLGAAQSLAAAAGAGAYQLELALALILGALLLQAARRTGPVDDT